MSYKCPICEKAGLEDYRGKHIICPNCNSDLKAYLLLNSIKKRGKATNYLTIIIFLILVIIFSSIYTSSIRNRDSLTKKHHQEIIVLEDSLEKLKNELTFNNQKAHSSEVKIVYIVKKGDYPARIAEFFYNDWRLYKKIEQDNNLVQPYVLKVGQPIIITLNVD